MKKFLLFALLAVSMSAHADYQVQINYAVPVQGLIFESCTVGQFYLVPNSEDTTYIQLTCDDEPVEGAMAVGTPNPNTRIEEFNIRFGADGELEMYDCSLETFIHEEPGETGTIAVLCGTVAVFQNGFEN